MFGIRWQNLTDDSRIAGAIKEVKRMKLADLPGTLPVGAGGRGGAGGADLRANGALGAAAEVRVRDRWVGGKLLIDKPSP